MNTVEFNNDFLAQKRKEFAKNGLISELNKLIGKEVVFKPSDLKADYKKFSSVDVKWVSTPAKGEVSSDIEVFDNYLGRYSIVSLTIFVEPKDCEMVIEEELHSQEYVYITFVYNELTGNYETKVPFTVVK